MTNPACARSWNEIEVDNLGEFGENVLVFLGSPPFPDSALKLFIV